MEWLLGALTLVVVGYLVRNGSKNADPLNRKTAAALCEYLVSTDEPDTLLMVSIYMENARYRKDAQHIASMVPAILVKAGMPRETALQTHKPLLAAANLVPE